MMQHQDLMCNGLHFEVNSFSFHVERCLDCSAMQQPDGHEPSVIWRSSPSTSCSNFGHCAAPRRFSKLLLPLLQDQCGGMCIMHYNLGGLLWKPHEKPRCLSGHGLCSKTATFCHEPSSWAQVSTPLSTAPCPVALTSSSQTVHIVCSFGLRIALDNNLHRQPQNCDLSAYELLKQNGWLVVFRKVLFSDR